jgi:hypothetical protein
MDCESRTSWNGSAESADYVAARVTCHRDHAAWPS